MPLLRHARLAVPVLLAAIVAIVFLTASSGAAKHEVFVTVASATNVLAGQEVRAAGQRIGKISSVAPVRGGRAVRLGIQIDDDDLWPLRTDAKVALRWGGTISYNNRYFALTPGRRGAAIPERGTLAARNVTLPVEFDQLLKTFDGNLRRDARVLLDRGGIAFQLAAPSLRRALTAAPPALQQGHAVITDLVQDTDALDQTVRSTDRVVDAVRTADPGVSALVQGAATTLTATASEAKALKAALSGGAPMLTRTRNTLARADGTLRAAGTLTGRLAPGVRQLRRIAGPLNSLLKTVTVVGPDARKTLATARGATPSLNPLLETATERAPQLTSIGQQATHELNCIRPYTPEIVAFASTWGDFLSATDGKDKYIRANIQVMLPAPYNVTQSTSGEIFKAFPGLRYGFPRPPGAVAGQPWFLPECGAGPEAINPFKDPEARR
ncbi:MAG: mammalian cell entry protein [Solirubrobacterales bacterium]|nr:mammalian cell entry protein [Solirubrobacterales bacterium]